MSKLLSVRDAAEMLDCSEWTVRGYIADGKLTSEKVGHAVILYRAEVEELAEARRKLKHGVANPEPVEVAK